MLHALGDRTIAPVLPIEFHEAGDLAHRRLLQCVQGVGSLDESGAWIYIFPVYIQEIVMKVAKWGNSLAVRLPAKLVAELGLAEGDEIQIVKASRERLEIERKIGREEAIEKLRKLREKYSGRLPAGYRFKRSDAYDDD
jgi:antitoxin MazE